MSVIISPMIMTCKPKSIFSSDSLLEGGGHRAELMFNWFGEQGSVSLDGKYYRVNKLGLFQGRWTLTDQSGVRVSAEKLSPFSRAFIIQSSGETYRLEAQSIFSRAMSLHGGRANLTIAPNHMLTRKTTLSGSFPDIETTCLAMWLTLLMWRRSSNNSSS
ncbi:hypothetical protein NT6N_37410 [Oceaniferula spumae]|uniref:Uncharacterized protein n=1 Tax=Oceaniferula spumae TaxID=2979115 RepID=A0AAT9FS39_9BACT